MAQLVGALNSPELYKRLTRFGVVGISLNVVLYALYVGITWVYENPQLVMTSLYIVGIASSYMINRSWSYRATEAHTSTAPRYFFAYFLGYLVQLVTLTVLYNGLELPHVFAQLIAMAVTAVCLFLLQHFWVFPLSNNGRAFPMREALWMIAVITIAIGLRMLAQWDELTTPSLTLDDLAVVPKIATDSSVIPGSVPVLILILKSLVGWLGSAEGVRLVLVIMMGAMAGGIFHIIRVLRLPSFVAALIAVLSVVNPIAPSQPIFINGAHPMIAGAFVLMGYLFAIFAFNSERRADAILFGVATLLVFVLAILTSPTAVLCSAAIFLIPFFCCETWPGIRKAVSGLILGLLPVLFYFSLSLFSTRFEHHYSSDSGLTSFSFTAVLNQFEQAWTLIASSYALAASWMFAVFLLTIAGISLFSLGIIIGRSKFHLNAPFVRALAVIAFLSAAGLLAFGPATVVTLMEDRYIGLAGIFVIAAICVLFAYSLIEAGASSRIVSVLLIACLGFSAVQLERSTRQQYSAAFSIQEKLIDGLRLAQDEWVEGAQIVVVTPVMSRFTAGYPHWSTGFVRYATGRSDVFGVVGPERNMNHYPFVGEYDLEAENYGHSSAYWVAGATPAKRKVMVGLQKERPIYAYVFDGEKIQAKDVQLSIRQGARQQYYVARAGKLLTPVHMLSMNDSSCPVEPLAKTFLALNYNVADMPEDAMELSIHPHAEHPMRAISNQRPFEMGGVKRAFLRLSTNAIAGDIELKLAPSGNVDYDQAYSDTFPPMPLLWHDVLRVDEEFSGALKVSSLGESWSAALSDSGEVGIRLIWKSDCFVGIETPGVPLRLAFVAPPPTDQFIIGKGYLERYWTGSINSVNGAVLIDDQLRTISIESFEVVSD